jgi:hypothetical protein
LSCIIDFAVFRPFEHLLAHALHLENAGDRFLSQLFPSLTTSPISSGDISTALKRDTLKYLGSPGVGLRDWRHITVGFCRAHKDPDLLRIRHGHIDPDNQIRGHTNETSDSNYAITSDDPVGVGFDKLWAHLRVAHWWFSLVGMFICLVLNKPSALNTHYLQASKVVTPCQQLNLPGSTTPLMNSRRHWKLK